MPRLAVVTGGTEGIGAAISQVLARAGYRVLASYGHDDEAAAQFENHTGMPAKKWDVCDYDACARAIADIEREHGGIDVLVNNAGVTADCMLHKMEPAAWHRVIETDLTSCFNMCRAVIAGMRERRFGRIVTVGSVNGQSGQAGQTNYAAAKAGIIGFSKSLALESAARGITVNVVAPGYTDTAMVARVPPDVLQAILKTVPVGRLAAAEEIARAVAFLVADDSGFITGTTLSVNGGRYMA